MIEIEKRSKQFAVRKMEDADAESILHLCQGNTLYYQYCEAKPTKEQILRDLRITPPDIFPSDKYYIGFFENTGLIAVMDLIDGYPKPENAFIGFFMVDIGCQGRNLGTSVMREAAKYLKAIGKTAILLGIDKGNPQSEHFWQKNGFQIIKEIDQNGRTVLMAEKILG